ncbi:MAG TPA: hypothetical protein VKZ79_18215 [Alphaproteobacteria bacterium]|nr:hypothetical protein [Alphaproteobacteria bacterium]
MADLPQPWRAYACLQAELARRSNLDACSWGIEAGLDHLASRDSFDDSSIGAEIAKARSTAIRRERSRARWRALRLAPVLPRNTAPELLLLARSDLRAMQSRVSASDWQLLLGLAEGEAYADLAPVAGKSAAALRVAATRLRARLRAALAAADRVEPILASVQ